METRAKPAYVMSLAPTHTLLWGKALAIRQRCRPGKAEAHDHVPDTDDDLSMTHTNPLAQATGHRFQADVPRYEAPA